MPENSQAVPMDPHVVMAEILAKLDAIAEATAGLDESLGVLADLAEAADETLMTLYEDGKKRLDPASFLRNYGQIRAAMEEEEDGEPDLEEPGSIPGPAAQQA